MFLVSFQQRRFTAGQGPEELEELNVLDPNDVWFDLFKILKGPLRLIQPLNKDGHCAWCQIQGHFQYVFIDTPGRHPERQTVTFWVFLAPSR